MILSEKHLRYRIGKKYFKKSYDAGERIEISRSYNENIVCSKYFVELEVIFIVTTYNLYKILPYSVRFIIMYCI